MNKRLKANFDVMMQHFHGNNKEYLADIVKKRMQFLAQADADAEILRTERRNEAIKRSNAATKLKVNLS